MSESVTGTARDVRVRNQLFGGGTDMDGDYTPPSSAVVIELRVEPQDGTPPVMVVIRGATLATAIRDGDTVEVLGRRRRGVVTAYRIDNRTTGSTVEVPYRRTRMTCGVVMGVWFVVFAVVFVVAAVVIVRAMLKG